MIKKQVKKPHLVFIYGFISVGKLTVAKELKKITKYKILHNHMIVDLISNLFESDDIGVVEKANIKEWIHFGLTEKLMNSKNNFIFTHAYSNSYISKNGKSDKLYVKKIETITNKAGGIFCPVYLKCDKNEMLNRLKDKSRENYGKLKSKKVMMKLIKNEDSTTPAPIKGNLIIDTTKNSPKKVAKIIKEHFKLS